MEPQPGTCRSSYQKTILGQVMRCFGHQTRKNREMPCGGKLKCKDKGLTCSELNKYANRPRKFKHR